MKEPRDDKNTDIQSSIKGQTELRQWLDSLITWLLRILAVVALPVLALALIGNFEDKDYLATALYVSIYISIIFVAFWRKSPYNLKVGLILVGSYALAVFDFSLNGWAGDGRVHLLLIPFVAALFLGFWPGIIAGAVSILTLLGLAWLLASGTFTPSPQTMQIFTNWDVLGTSLGIFIFTIVFINASLRYILPRFSSSLTESRKLADDMEQRAAYEREQARRLQELLSENITRMEAEQEQSERLQQMVSQLRQTANTLGQVSAQLLNVTAQQSGNASQQSAAISETATTVDEVRTIAEQVSMHAQEVANSAQRTLDISHSGRRAIQDTIQSMNEIKEKVTSIAQNILDLSSRVQQINAIITTVSDLSSQSNILALNASVEAARAQQLGRGFGVVAAEMRKLAEQSGQATVQVRTILTEILKATSVTVKTTQDGAQRVDQGVEQAALAKQAIEQLTSAIDESAQASIAMAAGGRQQSAGIDQVAVAMRSINQATNQNLFSTRQAEAAALELDELARQLLSMIDLKKLAPENLEATVGQIAVADPQSEN